jgi:hypothetical protein
MNAIKEFEKKWCKDVDSGFLSPFCHIDDIIELIEKIIGKDEDVLSVAEQSVSKTAMEINMDNVRKTVNRGIRNEFRQKLREEIS